MQSLEVLINPSGNDVMARLGAITTAAFDDLDGSEPVTGQTEDILIAPDLRSFLEHPRTELFAVALDNQIVGYNAVVPIDVMDPSRLDEVWETAYVYFTAVDPEFQGQGLVKNLMDDTFRYLRDAGYRYVEEDCVIANGYADKVERAYEGAIVEMYDAEKWPETGPERFFRIDLSKLELAT